MSRPGARSRRERLQRGLFALGCGTSLVACEALLDVGSLTERRADGGADATNGTMTEGGVDAAEASSAHDAPSGDVSDGAGVDGTATLDSGNVEDTGTADVTAVDASDAALDAPRDVATDSPTCTNACVATATQCGPGGIQTCETGDAGCTTWVTTTQCADGGCAPDDAGALACCANTCLAGASQCLGKTAESVCEAPPYGCTAMVSVTCSQGFVCEGTASSGSCVDTNWAEWPISNSPGEIDAGASTPQSYTDNGDGTVTDNVTGLMWQKTVTSSTYAWGSVATSGSAQYYCAHLSLAGHPDWRLPAAIELSSLLDRTLVNPAINTTYFPGTPSGSFWSSTPTGGNSSLAVAALFDSGGCDNRTVGSLFYARCVR